jgi:hypothetical protein
MLSFQTNLVDREHPIIMLSWESALFLNQGVLPGGITITSDTTVHYSKVGIKPLMPILALAVYANRERGMPR